MRTARRSLVMVASILSLSLGCSMNSSTTDVGDAAGDVGTSIADAAPTSADAAVAHSALSFASVLHESAPWLVLAQRDDDPSDGAYTEHAASEFHQVISRPIAASAMGSFASARAVRVFRGSQWVCDATVGAPVVLAVAEKGYDDDGEPMPRELHEVWESGLRAIAAPLTATRGDCSRGEWAQDATLDAPTFAAQTTIDARTTELIWQTMRTSEAGQRLQSDHLQECASNGPCAPSWDARRDVTRTVSVFSTRDGRRVVFAAIRSAEACGSFGAELTMVAELASEGSATVLRDVVFSEEATNDPDALIEGARYEWRSQGARIYLDARRELVRERADVPVYGCGC